AFSHRCCGTVWCPAVASTWLWPRAAYQDDDSPTPPERRHAAAQQAAWLEAVRSNAVARRWTGTPAAGDGPIDPAATPPARPMKPAVPEDLLRRTVVVVTHYSPNYVERLPSDVQASYQDCFRETIEAVHAAGARCVEVGRGYTPADFIDFCHPSADGAP